MRQPWNIYVYLYRQAGNTYEFALLKRKDDGVWQGISGGGEECETFEEAAHREANEEAGVPYSIKLQKLDTISYLQKTLFNCCDQWNSKIYVVPMYYYAAEYNGDITISSEHNEYKWLGYKEAQNQLYWQDNKTALWELNERLIRHDIE